MSHDIAGSVNHDQSQLQGDSLYNTLLPRLNKDLTLELRVLHHRRPVSSGGENARANISRLLRRRLSEGSATVESVSDMVAAAVMEHQDDGQEAEDGDEGPATEGQGAEQFSHEDDTDEDDSDESWSSSSEETEEEEASSSAPVNFGAILAQPLPRPDPVQALLHRQQMERQLELAQLAHPRGNEPAFRIALSRALRGTSPSARSVDGRPRQPAAINHELQQLRELRPTRRALNNTVLVQRLNTVVRTMAPPPHVLPAVPRQRENTPHVAEPEVRAPIPPRVDRLVDPPAVIPHRPRREENMTELRSLVARRLVSQILTGDVRAVLEIHVGHLYEHRRSQRQQQRQEAAPSPRQRPSPPPAAPVSAPAPPPQVSAGAPPLQAPTLHPAPTVPLALRQPVSQPGGHHVNEQLQMLTEAVEQMYAHMRTLFLMQQEMQASFHQQLACVLSRDGATTATSASIRGRPPNSNHCVVCMQESANAVLVGCGHLCACMACALDLKARKFTCPCCRAPIQSVVQVWTP